MAAASGLDKFRFMDDLAKLDASAENASTGATAENGTRTAEQRSGSPNAAPNTAAAAAAAAAAASRLLNLQRDLGGSSPMDFLRQLEASNRGRAGFDRLVSLASFGFPGLAGLPPLTPLTSAANELLTGNHEFYENKLKSFDGDSDRLTPYENNKRGE